MTSTDRVQMESCHGARFERCSWNPTGLATGEIGIMSPDFTDFPLIFQDCEEPHLSSSPVPAQIPPWRCALTEMFGEYLADILHLRDGVRV